MARTKPLAWYRQHCGNCPGGGPHHPNFVEGDIVILQNQSEHGQLAVVGKEDFPHYFEVEGRTGVYCETCFVRASDGFTVCTGGDTHGA